MRIDNLKRFGSNKKEAKQKQKIMDEIAGIKTNSLRTEGIHSTSSCDDYKYHSLNWAKWERANHPEKKFKFLDNIPLTHVGEWLQECIDKGQSAYTINSKSAALAKIMRCHSYDFGVKIPSRGSRDDITRSRNVVKYDKHFSLKNNETIIKFCNSTGVRRSELEQLKPEQIYYDTEGRLIIDLLTKDEYRKTTKGGRGRIIYVIKSGYDVVIESKENTEKMGQEHVFNKVHHAMDVHSCRRTFAKNKYCEVIANIKAKGLSIVNDYVCRDSSGRRFNRAALSTVSKNLGHNRLTVITKHYL